MDTGWCPLVLTVLVLTSWLNQSEAIIKDDSNGCSKIFTGAGGEILSPGYPEQYPDNAVCAWVIKAEDNYRIRLTFVDFQIEGKNFLGWAGFGTRIGRILVE